MVASKVFYESRNSGFECSPESVANGFIQLAVDHPELGETIVIPGLRHTEQMVFCKMHPSKLDEAVLSEWGVKPKTYRRQFFNKRQRLPRLKESAFMCLLMCFLFFRQVCFEQPVPLVLF